jgi:cysteine synthase A
VGISSGAAAYAAVQIGLREENHNKNNVPILAGTTEHYFSSELFDA